ncbi:extracellular solute-binding protein [Lentzea sp. NPDC051208]|uniref:sugar ABC transporter substrate-binding protein n=1 Tax=Lentzea sp. NPDC051208 TaxID=3154642 RepID=UPI003427FED5
MNRTRLTTGLLALVLVATSTACSSNDPQSGGSGSGTLTLWDPYPQLDAESDWARTIESCAAASGTRIERTSHDTTDLTNKVLLAAQQGTAPHVLVVDNPVVSTLAEGGVLQTAEELGLDTSAVEPNLLAAGRMNDKTYGVPIGANTLALYYNKAVLTAAGVDVASVRDWASLTEALEKVKQSGKKGITFSAVGTEEGSFQFLPWFWGAGANLMDLASDDAASALALWKSWLDKGYAPNSVIGNTQTTSWQEFATGEYAFAENGTWQLANAAKSGLDVGVLAIPGRNGGTAPAPTGGEFVTVPVQSDNSRNDTAKAVVHCLTSGENALTTDTALSYVSALPDVQAKQVAAKPELQVWVKAVKAAKGRTDDLGTRYPRVSEPLWNAVQAALTGAKSPKDALTEAQATAAAAN